MPRFDPNRPCLGCGRSSPDVSFGVYVSKGYKCRRSRCRSCINKGDVKAQDRRRSERKYKASKQDGYCEECGFRSLHSAQLAWHHVNGDRKDNSADNLQLICQNCHFYITFIVGRHKTDGRYKYQVDDEIAW